ncbi:YbaB/EbfC family nucleoid-associated protein [Nocardia xishanensis]|uniref:YbaB/EbfC family nucleoid-associated protein n=1 Tax=Nocardia xishanensis TaxID=238964 RepID=A0ABW7X9Y2_9NOCA
MTELAEWERHLEAALAEIRYNTAQLKKAVESVRGTAQISGVAVEVDADGAITELRITPGAMRWSNTQLAKAITDVHQRARADATARTDRILNETNPRLRGAIQQLRVEPNPGQAQRSAPPMSEEEIQAADDAYYERRNREGWNS